MKPLPSHDLCAQTRGGNRPVRRRSKRQQANETRIALRVSDAARASWIKAASREGYLSLSDWIRDRCDAAATARVLTSSDQQSWNTPRVVLEAIHQLGPIALDPCSNGGSIVGARVQWTAADDGLSRSWASAAAGGLIYVNPPYGDALPTWIGRCVYEHREGAELVALIPARVDTGWWATALEGGAVAALWHGRVKYHGAKNTAPFPIALLYWGPRVATFRRLLTPRVVSFAVHVDRELEAAE